MKPKVKRNGDILQLRYSLPYLVHTADIYPLSAPNGSQIILCGHEQGLIVLWRGGRPFRNTSRGEEDTAEFEDQEEEHDPSTPYASITQRLELPLGTAALHLAFPRLPQLSKPEAYPLAPTLLKHKIVVALACADSSVRLLTLPLTPPSPAVVSSKRLRENPTLCTAGHGTWGEELVIMHGAHQSLPKGVAAVFAPCSVTRADEQESDDSMDEGREGSGYDLLLASHSADLLGMVAIHRISVSEDGSTFDIRPTRAVLWRSRPLASPAASLDFYVSPSSSSSQTPRLLVAESNGPVRIFECCSSHIPDHGRWTLTLYPASFSSNLSHLSAVVDARWILGGRAIIVLTADGEWGIWNLSLSGTSRTILGNKPTLFTISGRVGPIMTSTTTPKTTTANGEAKSQLAPMTPSTRKIRQDALFASSNSQLASNRGGILVKLTGGSALSAEGDESLIIWHGNNAMVLPSIRTHWQTKFKGPSGLFTSGANGQIREVPSVSLGGELRTSVSTFPRDDSTSVTSPKELDFLVAGERSLTILAAPLTVDEEPTKALVPAESHALLQEKGYLWQTVTDQDLLTHGELGVDGLDRMLIEMEGQTTNVPSPTPAEKKRAVEARRKVGFR